MKLTNEFVSFNFRYNSFNDQGIEAIVRNLKVSLNKINLSGNQMSNKGALALSLAMRNIRQIILKNNNIGNEGALALLKGLLETPVVTLVLSKSYITRVNNPINSLNRDGISAFIKVLEEAPHFNTRKELILEGKGIEWDDKIIEQLQEVAKEHNVNVRQDKKSVIESHNNVVFFHNNVKKVKEPTTIPESLGEKRSRIKNGYHISSSIFHDKYLEEKDRVKLLKNRGGVDNIRSFAFL